MIGKTLNASRLQQEVSRRIQRLQEVVDDGVVIGVPRPQRQPPDARGCNWTMKHFGNASGFEAVIADVLAQVRAEYNLADDAPDAAGEAADPFGGASKPRERVDPFRAAEEARAPQPTRPRDPFATD